MNWKIEMKVMPDLQAMIRNCGDKRGVGMAIARAMDKTNDGTVNAIKKKISGPLLRVRSGKLRNSIDRTDAVLLTDARGAQVRSSVGSNVRFRGAQGLAYAAPLEFGSRPHVIRAKNGKALRFVIGGKILFRQSVNHPGNKPYAYISGTVLERTKRYSTDINTAAFEFLTGAK